MEDGYGDCSFLAERGEEAKKGRQEVEEEEEGEMATAADWG